MRTFIFPTIHRSKSRALWTIHTAIFLSWILQSPWFLNWLWPFSFDQEQHVPICYGSAFFERLDGVVPIFLLYYALRFAITDCLLIGWKMAQAIVLKMKGDLEVRVMIVWQLDILSVEGDLEVFRAKVQIVIDSCNSFEACPSIEEYFDENICKEKIARQLPHFNSKIYLLKDHRLISGVLNF